MANVKQKRGKGSGGGGRIQIPKGNEGRVLLRRGHG